MEKMHILEILPKYPFGLHHTYINTIESHLVIKKNPDDFTLWHDRLGYPDTIIMQKIIENSHGNSLKIHEIYQENKIICVAYSLGKLWMQKSIPQ